MQRIPSPLKRRQYPHPATRIPSGLEGQWNQGRSRGSGTLPRLSGVAQLAEQRTVNPFVGSSSLPPGAISARQNELREPMFQ